MNLKESFRYQNFLDCMMGEAANSIRSVEHCLSFSKIHHRNKSNPDAEDVTEVIDVEPFNANDDVIAFMNFIISEKEKLTKAITIAKNEVGFDIDAAVETNKFRQRLCTSVRGMLKYSGSRKVEQGRDYKFNVEGVQMAYLYEVEVISTEAFDRSKAKKLIRTVISESDKVSAEIDAAMINSVVKYEPPFDVNDSFEDVMSEFISSLTPNEEPKSSGEPKS